MAGRGSRPGEYRGGRKKGTRNKINSEAADKLGRLNCDGIEGMATIAMNNLPCGVCRGEGKTRYKIPNPVNCPECFTLHHAVNPKCKICAGTGLKNWGVRICESCWGTLYEACSPELRGKMFAELAQYVRPKLKSVEHSNPDGSMRPSWVVVLPQAVAE